MAEGCKELIGAKQKLTLEEGGAFEVKTSHTTLEMDGSPPLMNPFMANIYPPEAEKNPAEAKPITKKLKIILTCLIF